MSETSVLSDLEDRTEADFSYSNSDHEMPEGADKELRKGTHWMPHYAWDHYGYVWFEDGKFHERVMRYQVYVGTISGKSLRALIDAVNRECGDR